MEKTLIDYLEEAADYSLEEKRYLRTVVKAEEYNEFTYAQLRVKARRIASKLIEFGVEKGDQIIFQIKDMETFIYFFWGCLYVGAQPVPLSVTTRQNEKEESYVKLKNVFRILNQPRIIVENQNKDFYKQVFQGFEEKIIEAESFLGDVDNYPEYLESKIYPDDVAFIQFSSGSTGNSKGVVLKHYNLVTNVIQISEYINGNKDSISCSWMPLTHDMGLIGFHLTPLFAKCNQTIFLPEVFIRYPMSYMKYLSEQRVSYTGFPNFGIDWILRFAKPDKMEGLNFENLKCILNGAEPIDCSVSEKFVELFKNYGLDEESMCFSYGMAEACVGVALSGRRKIQTVSLERNAYSTNNEVKITEKSSTSMELAVIGKPLKGMDIVIIDSNERELSECEVGEICIKGRNVTEGYFDYDNKKIFTSNGYFKTGDLGFLYHGNIVISGRKKDIIFKNGANFYAHDLERIVGEVEPELKANVVVIQANNKMRKEAIVLMIKQSYSVEELDKLKKKINNEMMHRAGIIFDDFVTIKTILKTTSGKVKRYLLQQEYEKNLLV